MGVWIETAFKRIGVEASPVTPCMGVWIETNLMRWQKVCLLSHTLYGCVDWNKPWSPIISERFVTPCMGVWIETNNTARQYETSLVTPCMGVWIETYAFAPR